MKKLHLILTMALSMLFEHANAQSKINDESVRYQEQRMVFLQWDQNKFTPKAGFLSLNPYYWLTWGLFHPDYHKTDLRPLSATGPQTQRLALVGAMNGTDNKYKLQSDTLRNTALSEIAYETGTITEADLLWLLYYKKQFKPVLNYSYPGLVATLPPALVAQLMSEGLLDWYNDEITRLKQRVQGAHDADMDRGSRIIAYFRLLQEYKKLNGVWSIRLSTAAETTRMTAIQQKLQTHQTDIPDWTPATDVAIANKVLTHIQ